MNGINNEVPIRNKMYVLKNIAHELRAEAFKEATKPKRKFQAMAWQKNITGTEHIADMNYEQTLEFIVELYCKRKYKHSLSTLVKEFQKDKVSFKKKGYYKKIIKIPLTKLVIFFGGMKVNYKINQLNL
jgi:hypothetical protein